MCVRVAGTRFSRCFIFVWSVLLVDWLIDFWNELKCENRFELIPALQHAWLLRTRVFVQQFHRNGLCSEIAFEINILVHRFRTCVFHFILDELIVFFSFFITFSLVNKIPCVNATTRLMQFYYTTRSIVIDYIFDTSIVYGCCVFFRCSAVNIHCLCAFVHKANAWYFSALCEPANIEHNVTVYSNLYD